MISLNHVPPLLVNDSNKVPRDTPVLGMDVFLKEWQNGRIDFSKTNLSGLDLKDLNLKHCIFRNATMCGVTLDCTHLDNTDFAGADLTGAQLIGSGGTKVNMEGALLENSLIQGCTFNACDFSGTSMRNAQITLRSTFRNCAFHGSDLSAVSITDAKFTKVEFDSAKTNVGGVVCKSKFDDSSFPGTRLSLLFWKCKFHDADFAGTDFSNARFLSCAFDGPIDFQGCQGFDEVPDASLKDVNLLPLAQLPSAWRFDERYEKVRLHHQTYRPIWMAVVEGCRPGEHSPTLGLMERMERYKAEIENLDAPARLYLREKVSIFMAFTPETSAAYALFREIKKIDDEMAAREIVHAEDDPMSSRCMSLPWSEEDTDSARSVAGEESGRLSVSEPSIHLPHDRRISNLDSVRAILDNWPGESSPSGSLVVNLSTRERSFSDLDGSAGPNPSPETSPRFR